MGELQHMLVAEIGLNHCGKIDYADTYLETLFSNAPDAITFQIREPEYYQTPENKALLLPDDYYQHAIKKIKKRNLKFGVALSDPERIRFFNDLGVDFYKVIRNNFANNLLVHELLSTGKHIFVSTGMASLKEIEEFVEKYRLNKDQITLIHTQLTHSMEDVQLKAIQKMKQKFQLPVAFGCHAPNLNVIYMSLVLEPSDIFFYVRGNSVKIHHADQEHAVPLSFYSEFRSNIKSLTSALGTGEKITMRNMIEE